MQYSKLLSLCACFMIVFSVETASLKRQKPICIPCTDFKEWNICDSDGKDICITDKKQLYKTLQKTVNAVEVKATCKTDLQKSESDKENSIQIINTTLREGSIFIIVIFVLFVGLTLHGHIERARNSGSILCCMPNIGTFRRKWQIDSAHCMTRNKSEHPNTSTHLPLGEKTNHSEKERRFGHSGHIGSTDDAGGKMETDQSEIGAFALIGPSTHGKYTNGNAMETDQLEKDAVDVKMSAISLKETC